MFDLLWNRLISLFAAFYCCPIRRYTSLPLFLLFSVLLGSKTAYAQLPQLKKEVKNIDSLMVRYFSDFERLSESADSIYHLLQTRYTGAEFEDIRIQVMLQKSVLYALNKRHDLSLKIALEAHERAKKSSNKLMIYRSSLILASTYEVAGNLNSCKAYLDMALQVPPPDELFSIYCIRTSSYYSRMQVLDSAIFFAEKGLAYAKKYNNIREERDAYLLLGGLIKDPDKKIHFIQLSAQKFAEVEDYGSAAFQLSIAANNFFQKGDVQTALMLSDSAMHYVKKAKSYVNPNVYLLRSHLFEAVKNKDSAFYYYKLHHHAYVEELIRMEQAEMKRVDRSYQNEKQAAQLQNRDRWLKFTFVFVLFISLLAVLLYRKNRKIRSQQVQINQALDSLKELMAQKDKLDEAKNLFYANASHELRTPLTLILAPLERLINAKQLEESKRANLTLTAYRAAKTLVELVNQILTLGKSDKGTMELHLEPTLLKHYGEVCLAQFESLAESLGIHYTIKNLIPEHIQVGLDREKLRQVLSNLVSNALKFTQRGGEVHSRLRYDSGMLEFVIQDTGAGIGEEDLPFLFDRYFQVSKRGELAKGGMGIGLALSRDIIKLFRGTLEVDSILGKGSTFTVRFPVEEEKGPVSMPSEHLTHDSVITSAIIFKPDRPHLLIVDDNAALQDYLGSILSEEYNITLANNGLSALRELENNGPFDLIVSDVMMPQMDGYQLADVLKSSPQWMRIPLIMLTARADEEDRLKALKIGVDDYLTKPFSHKEIQVRIANLLKNYAVRRSAEETEDYSPTLDEIWLEKFDEYMARIYSQVHLKIPDIASEFAMSESTLLRKLKLLTGLTPQQYIQEYRLRKAVNLLKDKGYSVQQVAAQVGYQDARTFSRAYKARFGKSPSDS
jgi:signal transduction histidine kinase/CheY-like chemotaxis protein